jgi:SAM-dependent methyltransferase
VQKPDTPEWHADIASIYARYQTYHQGGGAEPLVYAKGQPQRRSDRLLELALPHLCPAPTGWAVDIGCGNGAMLRSLGKHLADWRLVGTDLNDHERGTIEGLPKVEKLHVGDIDSLPGQFDLATFLHALEHFPAPVKALTMLRERLGPKARVLVEVPDYVRNPFDLIVADHASHFSSESIAFSLRKAGFDVVAVTGEWIAREWSAVGQKVAGLRKMAPSSDPSALSTAVALVAWLRDFADQARTAVGSANRVAVFGTGNGATWLASLLSDRVDLFLDEDLARIGRVHLGRPVVSPEDRLADMTVVVPLPHDLARAISLRLARPGETWIIPFQ